MIRRWLLGISLAVVAIGTAHAAPVTPPAAYQASVVAKGLSHPVGATSSPDGKLFVAERGAGTAQAPRVVTPQRASLTVVARLPLPLTGITWHHDRLYVTYAGGIVEMSTAGAVHTVVTDLPSQGDHPNYAAVPGPDQRLYFGQGTATNSGVVGRDNLWVGENPGVHDIPCRDLRLRGPNFSTLKPEPITTGAFVAFGRTTSRGQVVKGAEPCNGAILRIEPNGTDMAVVAWGLRDPRSLTFGPDGTLYAAVRGMEDRGSRPVKGDRDYLYRIEPGRWYGWPDFAGSRPISETPFQKSSMPSPLLLLEPPEQQPQRPITSFAKADALSAVAILPDDNTRGLVALTGGPDHAGRLLAVDLKTGATSPFLPPDVPQPSHPTAITIGPKGDIYVTDLGGWENGQPRPEAGQLWRISRSTGRFSAGAPPFTWALCGVILAVVGTRLVLRREE